MPPFKLGGGQAELIAMTNLPTQAGPVPDRMTIWPMDDGRYGLDATFQGASGYERAERHKRPSTPAGWSTPFVRTLGAPGPCASGR
jgi:hypothetical protein